MNTTTTILAALIAFCIRIFLGALLLLLAWNSIALTCHLPEISYGVWLLVSLGIRVLATNNTISND